MATRPRPRLSGTGCDCSNPILLSPIFRSLCVRRDQGAIIAAVVERLGAKEADTVLPKRPLLRVLPGFVEYMSTKDDDSLWSAIETRDKRNCLVEELQSAK